MRTWFERVRETILDTPSPVIIEAGDEWGVSRLLAGLRDPVQPLIWIDLREVDCSDSVVVGNAVSEAVRRGLGSPLFGLGIDTDYALAALASYLPALEPLTIAVSGAEKMPELVSRLSGLFGPTSRFLVHTASHVNEFDSIERIHRVERSKLKVTIDEAVDLFGGECSTADICLAVNDAGGALLSVESRLMLDNGKSGEAKGLAGQIGAAFRQGANGVIDALVARRRWIEAFEFAVDQAPTRIGEVLDDAANAYFELGQFERLWRFLSDVPRWALRDERSMYWLFNAAMAVNEWRSVLPHVNRYLENHEAPDLRALRATADVRDSSLAEATRAHRAKQSAETARALAFISEFRGDLDTAASLYREAIELAEVAGRPRHVVGASAGMAQVHLFGGRYERAQHWGAWAVRQYGVHELREELLRVAAIGVCGYARLLVGAVHLARQVLETVKISKSMVGIPMVEGVISTLGDLAIVDGRYDDAVAYYRMNLEGSTRGMYPTLANDLVLARLVQGDVDRAIRTASEASEIGDLSGGYQHTAATLALGCALARSDADKGERLLRASLSSMRIRPLGPHRAQGALHLGRLLVRQGRSEEARQLLEENARFIADLGDSGWLLLGGTGPEVAQLKRMFRRGEPEIELRVLGRRYLRNRDAEDSLSLRFAELLAVLAANPEGIRSQQLALALYGDRANASTLKVTISRARRLLRIESRPYRIGETYRADFLEALEHLRTGRVQAALELYHGPLLAESEAPAVVELREHLEESLRQAVLASGDPDAMIDLATQQGDDLELWEETRLHLPPNDPRRPLVNARIRRIRKRWEAELG